MDTGQGIDSDFRRALPQSVWEYNKRIGTLGTDPSEARIELIELTRWHNRFQRQM